MSGYDVAGAAILAGERIVWVGVLAALGALLLAVGAVTVGQWRTSRRAAQAKARGRRRAPGPASGPRTLAGDLAVIRDSLTTWVRSIHLTRRGRADAALEQHLTACLDERIREMTGANR